MKTCSKCHETKPTSEFSKNKSTKDKLRYDCKICCAKDTKRIRAKNKEIYGKTRSPAQEKSNREYRSSKRGHIDAFKSHAMQRAKNNNLPFDLDMEYLLSIATDTCPVFGQKFRWGRHKGNCSDFTPSLDRVIPSLGYVKGNVVFISILANRLKNDATEVELYAVADWLHQKRKEVLNALKK